MYTAADEEAKEGESIRDRMAMGAEEDQYNIRDSMADTEDVPGFVVPCDFIIFHEWNDLDNALKDALILLFLHIVREAWWGVLLLS